MQGNTKNLFDNSLTTAYYSRDMPEEGCAMAGVLQGKTAIVTGSTRGIGRAVAEAFAAEGANVVVHGTDEPRAAETAGAIRAAGGMAAVCLGEVADAAFAPRLADFAVDRFGGIDILVANAGMSGFEPFLTMSAQTWQRFLDVHLSGAFLCGQAAARRMVAQGRGGRILNMSSVAGRFAMHAAGVGHADQGLRLGSADVIADGVSIEHVERDDISLGHTAESAGGHSDSDELFHSELVLIGGG